jgi:hypothetical protein
MANCPNCGAVITCGCQRKTASDGKQGCSQCIPAYEQALKRRTAGGNNGKGDPASQPKTTQFVPRDPRLN